MFVRLRGRVSSAENLSATHGFLKKEQLNRGVK
jgi:hypothetical protein